VHRHTWCKVGTASMGAWPPARGIELEPVHVVSSWSLCTWYRPGACARGIQLEPVHVVSSWSLCTWYPAGACARGIDLEPVHVVSTWSLCTWYPAGACARGIELEPVHVVSIWSLCTWYRAGAQLPLMLECTQVQVRTSVRTSVWSVVFGRVRPGPNPIPLTLNP
jgi:hypothetical protein